MNFDEAFEKLVKMADGKPCQLQYTRMKYTNGDVSPLISCYIADVGGFTPELPTFEGVLTEMALKMAGHKDEPQIEG